MWVLYLCLGLTLSGTCGVVHESDFEWQSECYLALREIRFPEGKSNMAYCRPKKGTVTR